MASTAGRGQIRAQFLTESVMLCGLGGRAGVLLGAMATTGYVAAQNWPTVIPSERLIIALLAILKSGAGYRRHIENLIRAGNIVPP